jgi:hypothetical protein
MGQINIFGEYPAPPLTYPTKGGGSITSDALEKADRDTQKEVMEFWFYNNYEDPVHSCPHNSEEGGYQFIYGGPYEAQEELEEQFSGIVPDDVIEELAEELNGECSEWSGNSDIPPNDDDQWDYLPSDELPKHLQTFKDSISNVSALLEVNVEKAQQKHFRGMLYVSVIIAMEAYLLDNFLSCLDADMAVFRKFVETTEHFRKQKIPLSTIYSESEGIQKRGRSYLTKMLWHRLGEAATLYRNTLGVRFPEDMKGLSQAVQIRHDFVHRNGRTADGKELNLTVDEIKELMKAVESLVGGIELQQKSLLDKAKASAEPASKDGSNLGGNTVSLELPPEPHGI